MQRRSFLNRSIATSAGLSLATFATTRAAGANERVRVGWIGCGGRGSYVANHMQAVAGVEFVAVCDVHADKLAPAKRWAGPQCETYSDFRHVLDRNDVDAVLIATPDHWHAIPTILACAAGKDVYVEKPLAHTIHEGRAMINAARKHGRVVQTGTQQRSAAHFETMREIIASGRVGNVRFVRIWNFQNTSPGRLPPKSDGVPPKELDWDFFVGPAPWVEYDYNRYANFRRFRDYSGGLLTDYGTHRFDSMRQAMSLDGIAPKTVSATGRRFEVLDGSEDPDMLQVTYEYEQFVLSYEGCMMNALGSGFRTPGRPYYRMLGTHDRPHGMAFYGTEGTIFADRLGFELYPELKPGMRADRLRAEEVKPELFRAAAADGRSDDSTFLHTQNFIDCVRSRAKPLADVEIGHASTLLPHLGNIALRTGEKLHWDAHRETITNSAAAVALLRRAPRKPWDLA